MNQKQENKLTRAENVDEVLDFYSGIVASIPALAAAHAALKNDVVLINNKESEKTNILTGKAADKYSARNILRTETLAIGGAIYALGKDTSNNTLIETGDFTESKMTRMRDTALTIFCESVRDIANGVIAQLLPYGIDAARMTAFDGMITAYSDALSAREGAQSVKSGMTGTVETLFDTMDERVETIGKLAHVKQASEPEFFSALESAMVIRNLGESSGVYAGTTPPTETELVFSSTTMNPLTKFKIKNRGTGQLTFFISADGIPAGGSVILTAGEEVIKFAQDLGVVGTTRFWVKNNDATAEGNWRVKRYIGT